MPLRATPKDVTDILDTEVNVLPFLVTASVLIDTHLGAQGLSTALLKELERWLTAWLVCTRDPRFTQVSTDGQSMTFTAQDYWEKVRLLDSTGILAQVLTTKRISIKVY